MREPRRAKYAASWARSDSPPVPRCSRRRRLGRMTRRGEGPAAKRHANPEATLEVRALHRVQIVPDGEVWDDDREREHLEPTVQLTRVRNPPGTCTALAARGKT